MSKMVLVKCKRCGKEFHVSEKTYKLRGENSEFYCRECHKNMQTEKEIEEKKKHEEVIKKQIEEESQKLLETGEKLLKYGICITLWNEYFGKYGYLEDPDTASCRMCPHYSISCRIGYSFSPSKCFSEYLKPRKGMPIIEEGRVAFCSGDCKGTWENLKIVKLVEINIMLSGTCDKGVWWKLHFGNIEPERAKCEDCRDYKNGDCSGGRNPVECIFNEHFPVHHEVAKK